MGEGLPNKEAIVHAMYAMTTDPLNYEEAAKSEK